MCSDEWFAATCAQILQTKPEYTRFNYECRLQWRMISHKFGFHCQLNECKCKHPLLSNTYKRKLVAYV